MQEKTAGLEILTIMLKQSDARLKTMLEIVKALSGKTGEELKCMKQALLNNCDVEKEIAEEVLEEKIRKTVKRFGSNPNLLGHRYLIEAVKMMINNGTGKLHMTKEIYPTIAEKFESTDSKVERALRHNIQNAWETIDKEFYETITGYPYNPYNCYHTNSSTIAILAEYIKSL